VFGKFPKTFSDSRCCGGAHPDQDSFLLVPTKKSVRSFIRVASAGREGAGPGTGFYCVALPRHCEGGYGKVRYQIEEEAFRR